MLEVVLYLRLCVIRWLIRYLDFKLSENEFEGYFGAKTDAYLYVGDSPDARLCVTATLSAQRILYFCDRSAILYPAVQS